MAEGMNPKGYAWVIVQLLHTYHNKQISISIFDIIQQSQRSRPHHPTASAIVIFYRNTVFYCKNRRQTVLLALNPYSSGTFISQEYTLAFSCLEVTLVYEANRYM